MNEYGVTKKWSAWVIGATLVVGGATSLPSAAYAEVGATGAVQSSQSAASMPAVALRGVVPTKKKQQSVASFVKGIDKSARKASGQPSSKDSRGGVFKAKKSQKWWVPVKAKGFRATGSNGVAYGKAIVRALKAKGLKQRSVESGMSPYGGQYAMRAFSNKRFTCTVRVDTSSDFSCAKTSSVKKAYKKSKPFGNALKKWSKSSTKNTVITTPKVKKSKSFPKYKRAKGQMSGASYGYGGGEVWYAKAPGKKWVVVGFGMGSIPDCTTTTAKRAWAGAGC